MPRQATMYDDPPLYEAECAPSVQGGLWVIYGWARWPSYSVLLVPGTLACE
jgi:hypothetical protein